MRARWMPASSERDVRVRALLGAELVAGCSEGLTPAQPSLARKDRALPGGRGKGETPGTSRVVSRRTPWATPGWPRNEGGGNHPYRAALAPALRPCSSGFSVVTRNSLFSKGRAPASVPGRSESVHVLMRPAVWARAPSGWRCRGGEFCKTPAGLASSHVLGP